MSDDVELLRRVYALFNGRDIESVLAAMHLDVIWANGMEGGHVHGRDEVRSYWKRQWAILNPHVEPVEISSNGEGEVVVKVHQVLCPRPMTFRKETIPLGYSDGRSAIISLCAGDT